MRRGGRGVGGRGTCGVRPAAHTQRMRAGARRLQAERPRAGSVHVVLSLKRHCILQNIIQRRVYAA